MTMLFYGDMTGLPISPLLRERSALYRYPYIMDQLQATNCGIDLGRTGTAGCILTFSQRTPCPLRERIREIVDRTEPIVSKVAMFSLNDTMRYFLCPGRTDMRKGISSLCGVVHEKMRSEVKNGDVFIFVGSSRKLIKLLHAEDGGMVMYVKRLEAGRFKLPEYDPESNSYPME